MRRMVIFFLLFRIMPGSAQEISAEKLLAQVVAKVNSVNDYEARGTMKLNVSFIKAPVSEVTVFFKKPDKLRIKNESGIALVPKGSAQVSISSIIASAVDSDIIDLGLDNITGWRTIKLLPKDETSDIILSTLYIDEKLSLVRKARTTTRESGTYELEMAYGKYASYGLADKLVFTFNTRDYKLPKGVTFDYDGGTLKKDRNEQATKDEKGIVEFTYSYYKINKGVPDTVFK